MSLDMWSGQSKFSVIKKLLLIVLCSLPSTLPTGLYAQSLDESGRALLDNLIEEWAPLMDDARGLGLEWSRELGRLVDDLSVYEMPELLPNGDIIIRRKQDDPPSPAAPSAPIDL